MARLQDQIQRGTRASQPLATAVSTGALYGVTDEGNIIERSNGTTWQAFSPSSTQTGTIVQVVNTQTGAVATGTTTIPEDDTPPQKTEGTEFMTLAVTPTDAANKLRIEVLAQLASSVATSVIGAIFQDSGSDALAAVDIYFDTNNAQRVMVISHYMTAGTTSSTTFKVRVGPSSAATVTFNGRAGTREFGGVIPSSITITEIVP